MPKSGTFGSVRGVSGNGHSYRDQFFSGMDYYEPRLPCDPTQIGRFRRLLGEDCARRPNLDHPCRLNSDQGWKASSLEAGCG